MVKPNRSEAILKKTSRYFGDRLEDSQILREPFQIADRVGMNSMPKGRRHDSRRPANPLAISDPIVQPQFKVIRKLITPL